MNKTLFECVCFACGKIFACEFEKAGSWGCSECEEVFEDIQETIYDTKIFRYGREIRPAFPHEREQFSFVMLKKGEQKLMEIFQEKFPKYDDKNYWKYAKKAGIGYE